MEQGEILKELLKRKRVSQSEVAQKIGMKHKSFNAVLNGHARLSVDVLKATCEAIGVSPGYFFNKKVQGIRAEIKKRGR